MQGTVAQSTPESELTASVKGSIAGLGLVSLACDLGIGMDVRLHVDASATLGIIEMRGLGRVGHFDVGTLWLQAQQLHKVVEVAMVEGLNNNQHLLY